MPTDSCLQSIICNDSIEVVNTQQASSFQNVPKLSDPNDSRELEDFFSLTCKRLLTNSKESEKNELIAHLIFLSQDSTVSNYISNNLLDFFCKQFQKLKTSQLRLSLCTLIGCVLRYSTDISHSVDRLAVAGVL
jgi:hypothetical protein